MCIYICREREGERAEGKFLFAIALAKERKRERESESESESEGLGSCGLRLLRFFLRAGVPSALRSPPGRSLVFLHQKNLNLYLNS